MILTCLTSSFFLPPCSNVFLLSVKYCVVFDSSFSCSRMHLDSEWCSCRWRCRPETYPSWIFINNNKVFTCGFNVSVLILLVSSHTFGDVLCIVYLLVLQTVLIKICTYIFVYISANQQGSGWAVQRQVVLGPERYGTLKRTELKPVGPVAEATH